MSSNRRSVVDARSFELCYRADRVGAIKSAIGFAHIFTVGAPRGRGVSKDLEAGRPRPASGNTPWTHDLSSRTLNCTSIELRT
jgi:hypothetical protein